MLSRSASAEDLEISVSSCSIVAYGLQLAHFVLCCFFFPFLARLSEGVRIYRMTPDRFHFQLERTQTECLCITRFDLFQKKIFAIKLLLAIFPFFFFCFLPLLFFTDCRQTAESTFRSIGSGMGRRVSAWNPVHFPGSE